jgi:hypothetical protein
VAAVGARWRYVCGENLRRKSPADGVSKCARGRVERRGPEGGRGVLNRAGIGDGCHGYLQTPARNRSVARPRFREGAKGDGGGRRGVFITAARRRLKQAMKGDLRGEVTAGSALLRRDFGPGKKVI